MSENFKNKYTLTQRKELSSRLKEKYPDRVPVIIIRGGRQTPIISKHKFLVPESNNIGKFMQELRYYLPLNNSQSIFIHANNRMLKASALMSTIYELEKDQDGFVYLTYCIENSFGY